MLYKILRKWGNMRAHCGTRWAQRGRRRGSRGWAVVVLCDTASQLQYPRQVGLLQTARAKMLCNSNFYGYICVLLVKTISMIYICCIKYWENNITYVLAVGHNELIVGDNKDAHRRLLRDGARVGGRERSRGGSWTCHVAGQLSQLAGSGSPRGAQELAGTLMPK